MRGMRQAHRQTSYAEARRYLEEAPYGVLSTLCDDGQPYGVPLSFVLSGNALYFHCAAEGQKLSNITRCDRACFTAVADAAVHPKQLTASYRSAIAFGSIHIVENDTERCQALRLLCRKYAPDGPSPEPAIARSLDKTLILRLDVEYISGKCHPAP